MNPKLTIPARSISAASLQVPKNNSIAQSETAATDSPIPPRSAAGISVPKSRATGSLASNPASPSTQAKVPGLTESLKHLIDEFGPKANKHEVVTALIYMCIGEGLNTNKQIIGTIYRLGYNNVHVAMMLKEGTGLTIATGNWCRNTDKTYALLT